MDILGIDFGGSGIKGALVDIKKGELTTERLRLPTSEKSKPKEVARIIDEICKAFHWKGKMGVGFPAVIKDGVSHSAANINRKWVGMDVKALLQKYTGCDVFVINDADAAGLAEMTFGTGREYQKGTVLMLTLGTGIGSAVFVDGKLLPNCELGHLQIRGKMAEHRASDAVRRAKDLSWQASSKRLQE